MSTSSILGQNNCDCFDIQEVQLPRDSTEFFTIKLSTVGCQLIYLDLNMVDYSTKDTLLKTHCACLAFLDEESLTWEFGYRTTFPPLTINFDPATSENPDSVIVNFTGSYECSEVIPTPVSTGIQTLEAAFIKIYPNPVSDYATIEMAPEVLGHFREMRIFDREGRLVGRESIQQARNRVNFSNFEVGRYELIFISQNNAIRRKSVVKIE